MDTAELSFNAWILIGNVLHTLLRRSNAIADSPGRDHLQRLDTLLESVQPSQILHTLNRLTAADRNHLFVACQLVLESAGTEAQALLGMNQAEAAPILALLQAPPTLA